MIVSSAWIVFSKKWTKPVTAHSVASTSQVKIYNQEEIKNLAFNQLLNGDFSSVQGKWSNNQQGEQRVAYRIEENLFFIKDKRYYLSVGGKTENGVIYFNTHEQKNAAPLTFYPEGTPIPVRLENGLIDTKGEHDPSDRTQARFLLAQTILTAEQIKNNVVYRKN